MDANPAQPASRTQVQRHGAQLREIVVNILYLIFAVIVFVIPAVCILGDNRMWERKK